MRLKLPLLFVIALLASCGGTVKQYEKSVTRAIPEPQGTRLANRSNELGNPGDGRSGVRLISNGEEALAARLLLAKRAEKTIDAQYYLLHNDATGHLFASSLLQAADRGVRVRLLLDDMDTSHYDAMTAALDLHPKIEIRLFNPFWREKGLILSGLTDFKRVNRRMHNKSMTFDNAVTIVGGRNIGAEYFLAKERMNYVDLDVLAAGPVVLDVSASFDEYWNSKFAVPARVVIGEPKEFSLKDARIRLAELKEEARQSDFGKALIRSANEKFARETFKLTWVPARLYADPASKTAGDAQKEELLASQLSPYFENAGSEVRIVSAYFVPQTNGVNWLAGMEARGVEVDVVTNSIGSNDVIPVYAHYAKKRKALLRAGVELYELRTDALQSQKAGVYWWQSRSGLHTKAFMIDDRYLFVGSFNMDPRSVNINSEMGIMLDAPSLTARLNKSLDQALPVSTYHLGLDERGQINWTTRRSDGAISLYKSEPTGTTAQHLWADILGVLPIGSQL
ncbi:phospholipase [Sulfitobacter sp. SK012]|uniref:phospholipase D family protein n=1 Tax=Sulfitobacter sp. SK012 TaxID=1389005 RepID=UPI000E0A4019|nr:phospholipase D family protein [Sulfitobacter sp. SK012]AXI47120.1 phospholipase [Sulfitobacter sp. SK012]